jgi:hypothetical protein
MAAESITNAICERLFEDLEDIVRASVTREIEKLSNHLLKKGVSKVDLEKYMGDFYREGSYVADSSDIVLVRDYSDVSHAMFGKLPEDFTTSIVSTKKSITFNKKLAYGPGYLITKKDDYSLKELSEDLRVSNIPFKSICMAEFTEIYTKPSYSSTKPVKHRLPTVSKYEHKIHEDTGFVVDTVMIGKSREQIIVGTLAEIEVPSDSSTQPFQLVVLTDEQIEECKKRCWKYLSPDSIQLFTPIKQSRYKRLLMI